MPRKLLKTKPALILVGVSCLALLASVFAANGPQNDGDKVWQVRYHKTHPNKNNDIAMRLDINRGSGTKLDATLWRYDDVESKKYKLRKYGGKISMSGNVTKTGGGKERKRESFKLTGTYSTATGATANVLLQGFHHTGSDRNSNADDWLCIRVYDDSIVYLKAPGTDNCDEQPPDEDNLSEEPDTTMPPDYDAENP